MWLRGRNYLGQALPKLLKNRGALEKELRRGGMHCALVIEFKYGGADKIDDRDKTQAQKYCNDVSERMQRDGLVPTEYQAVPGYVLAYLGVAHNNRRAPTCVYGIRMTTNLADIDASTLRGADSLPSSQVS